MSRILLSLALLLAVPGLVAGQPPAEEELKRIAQELLDAVAPGDKAVWDKYLDESCLYSAEDGRTYTKAELLAELRPLPDGYVGKLQVANPQVRVHGETAVLTYDAMEDLAVFGQKIATRFHTTDTYVRRADGWRLVASQVTVVPGDPPVARLDPALYADYTGEYELAPGVRYVVTREGGALFGQRTGRDKEALLPEAADRFFRKGARGTKIFARGADGRVTALIDRRDNNDLVWKRVR